MMKRNNNDNKLYLYSSVMQQNLFVHFTELKDTLCYITKTKSIQQKKKLLLD